MGRDGFDSKLLFTNAVNVTNDQQSSVIDLGAAGALPEGARLVINFGTVAGTTPSLDIGVQTSSNGTDFVTQYTSKTVNGSIADSELVLPLPAVDDVLRYLRLDFNVDGTGPEFKIESARIAL